MIHHCHLFFFFFLVTREFKCLAVFFVATSISSVEKCLPDSFIQVLQASSDILGQVPPCSHGSETQNPPIGEDIPGDGLGDQQVQGVRLGFALGFHGFTFPR